MKHRILLCAVYMLPEAERFVPFLEQAGIEVEVADVQERLSEGDLMKYAGLIDGAICGDDRFGERMLEASAPRLKVISKWGTGVDSIDLEAAARLGVSVKNTPGAFTVPVAESVIGYVLAFARKTPWMDRDMKRGIWRKLGSHSLAETALGVVGVGRIGSAVLQRASPFGMNLLGNDLVEPPREFVAAHGIGMVSLDELLARADYVSLNCDLNPTSHHLIGARELGLMRSSAVLINTARGPIVDEPALIAALEAGRIRGAALDVFEQEPLPQDSPLLALDNVLLAPHNSNSSPAAWERVHLNTIRNLLEGMGIEAEGLEGWDSLVRSTAASRSTGTEKG